MKKPKTVWITRDNEPFTCYEIWEKEPIYVPIWGHWKSKSGSSGLDQFCPKKFEKMITLKLGTGKQAIIKGHFKFIKEEK